MGCARNDTRTSGAPARRTAVLVDQGRDSGTGPRRASSSPRPPSSTSAGRRGCGRTSWSGSASPRPAPVSATPARAWPACCATSARARCRCSPRPRGPARRAPRPRTAPGPGWCSCATRACRSMRSAPGCAPRRPRSTAPGSGRSSPRRASGGWCAAPNPTPAPARGPPGATRTCPGPRSSTSPRCPPAPTPAWPGCCWWSPTWSPSTCPPGGQGRLPRHRGDPRGQRRSCPCWR